MDTFWVRMNRQEEEILGENKTSLIFFSENESQEKIESLFWCSIGVWDLKVEAKSQVNDWYIVMLSWN